MHMLELDQRWTRVEFDELYPMHLLMDSWVLPVLSKSENRVKKEGEIANILVILWPIRPTVRPNDETRHDATVGRALSNESKKYTLHACGPSLIAKRLLSFWSAVVSEEVTVKYDRLSIFISNSVSVYKWMIHGTGVNGDCYRIQARWNSCMCEYKSQWKDDHTPICQILKLLPCDYI
jgi:hypothetical protein